jgi:phage-related protein
MANNTKMNISYSIRAVDRFSKVHDKLDRQLSSLQRMTEGLTRTKEIDIGADTSEANRKIDRTKEKVDSLPRFKKIRLVIENIDKGLQSFDKLATRFRTIDEISAGMVKGGIFTAAPALGPALAIVAGGAGALASSLVGAGAALGGFAAVAVPTISYLAEMDKSVKRGSEEWNNLSKATRGTLSELDTFRSKWAKLQEKFREPVLNIFTQGLKSAQKLLKLFEPTIDSSVKAMGRLAKSFDEALGSGDVKNIFKWLGETAGSSLEKLAKSVGNFAVGFGNMMVAFDPLAQDFMNGFLKMSEKFREWSSTLESNQAFQKFISYVQTNGPTLLGLIGNITKFLVNLGIAMEPIGTKVLELVNSFFAWSSELVKNNEWIGKLIGVAIVLKGAIGVLAPIVMGVISVFKFLWPVISKVFTWFGKLQGVIMRIMPWVVRVGSTILRLSNPIGIIISIVGLLASILISHWDEIWAWTKKTFANIARWIIEKWKQVKAFWSVLGELVNVLKTKFGEMVSAVFEKMGEIYKDIKGKWNDIKSFLSGISLKSIGANIIQGLINGITSIDVKGAVEGVASKIKDGFLGFFNIHSPSRLMKKDVGRWITLGVLDGMTSMQSKAEREAERVANAIKRPFDTMSTDYAFSASGTAVARQSYENARTSRYQTSATSEGSTSPETKQPGVQYAVVNIGGYEAKGAIEYITQEQARAKSRKERFKG